MPGSVPITSFGSFDRASVATLSINPSYLEFTNTRGSQLVSGKNRVISRYHLSEVDAVALNRESALRAIESFRDYFDPNSKPYRRWFSPMEKIVLASVGASYWDGSATHLDLSQWATNPVWKKLSDETKQALLVSDLPFLRKQIEYRKFDLVLINGATAITEISKTGLVDLSLADEVDVNGTKVLFFRGQALGTQFIAWNWYLQSAISEQVRIAISLWLKANA